MPCRGTLIASCVLLGGCARVFGLSSVADDGSGAIDAGSDARTSPCWAFDPANYAPCDADFPVALAALDLSQDGAMSTAAVELYRDTGMVLLRFPSIHIAAGATFTIFDDRPVIVATDGDIQIDGTFVIAPTTTTNGECSANSVMGVSGTNTSPGGGGGSYGALGGLGGTSSGGGPQVAGSVNGKRSLVPLRVGCPGGRSGDAKASNAVIVINGSNGGRAGGALELSAQGTLTVGGLGAVLANGGGGAGGKTRIASNCGPNAHNCTSGGGGGGSGGALLVEATHVLLAGSVCAVGGGGGSGGLGGQGGNGTPTDGSPGALSLSCAGGSGGGATVAGGNGGDTGAARSGGDAGGGGFDSGGGGGGGIGRIRVIGHPDLVSSGTVTPIPMN